MTHKDIVAEFEHREAAEGGIARTDARRIAEAIAKEHGLSYETVREALVNHWVARAN